VQLHGATYWQCWPALFLSLVKNKPISDIILSHDILYSLRAMMLKFRGLWVHERMSPNAAHLLRGVLRCCRHCKWRQRRQKAETGGQRVSFNELSIMWLELNEWMSASRRSSAQHHRLQYIACCMTSGCALRCIAAVVWGSYVDLPQCYNFYSEFSHCRNLTQCQQVDQHNWYKSTIALLANSLFYG